MSYVNSSSTYLYQPITYTTNGTSAVNNLYAPAPAQSPMQKQSALAWLDDRVGEICDAAELR